MEGILKRKKNGERKETEQISDIYLENVILKLKILI